MLRNQTIKTASKQDRTWPLLHLKRPTGHLLSEWSAGFSHSLLTAASSLQPLRRSAAKAVKRRYPHRLTTPRKARKAQHLFTLQKTSVTGTWWVQQELSKSWMRTSNKTSVDCWERNFVIEICICFCTRNLLRVQITHRLINQNKASWVVCMYQVWWNIVWYCWDTPWYISWYIMIHHNIPSDIIAISKKICRGTSTCQKCWFMQPPIILQIMWIQGIWCLKTPPTSKQLIAISASKTWLCCLDFCFYQLGNALQEMYPTKLWVQKCQHQVANIIPR